MKTSTNTIASMLAAAIWADGVCAEEELIAANEVAEAFELPEEEFQAALDAALKEVENMDGESINAYLTKNAAEVDTEEIGHVYEAVMQILLSDGVLTNGEANNLLATAEALGIDIPTAVLLLCDMVKSEPELEISFEDNIED